jgi:hypothetical protein
MIDSIHPPFVSNHLQKQAKLTEDPPSDNKSSLILPSTPTAEDEYPHPDANLGDFRGASVDEAQMKRMTHNDPVAKLQDMNKLYGSSTRMLYNSIASHSQDKLSASLRKVMVDHYPHKGKDGTNIRQQRRPSLSVMVYNQQKETAALFLKMPKI